MTDSVWSWKGQRPLSGWRSIFALRIPWSRMDWPVLFLAMGLVSLGTLFVYTMAGSDLDYGREGVSFESHLKKIIVAVPMLVVGLVFLLGQRTSYPIVNGIVREVVEFIRSTPLLVQLFFVYFVAPQFGLELSAWTSAMLTIGLHFGTYLSEVYRGSLEAIPKGQ